MFRVPHHSKKVTVTCSPGLLRYYDRPLYIIHDRQSGITVGFFLVLVNGFEVLLYLQQRGAVIINHPTIQANIGWHIRDKEIVLVPIVNVANTTFLKPFTTAIIAVLIFVIIH